MPAKDSAKLPGIIKVIRPTNMKKVKWLDSKIHLIVNTQLAFYSVVSCQLA